MISKTGNLYYSDKEKELALANNNALEYALSKGYNLVRTGNSFYLKEHDSMVFLPDGKWFWNSQGVSGGALDFIQKYEGRSQVEAVLILAGSGYSPSPSLRQQLAAIPKERKPLVMPEPAADNQAVIKYLIDDRRIDRDVVSALIRNKSIYQSAAYNNLVMVGFSSEGEPKYAALRSTGGKKFRIDVEGSDKSYPFVIPGASGTDTIVVVESPIEAMSYFCLCRALKSPHIHFDIVAAGGATARVGIERYLNEHPHITSVVSGLNNDDLGHTKNAGLAGTGNLITYFGDKYAVTRHKPHLNDWNDVLCSYKERQLIKAQEVSPVGLPEREPPRNKSAGISR